MKNIVHLSNPWLRLPVRAFQIVLSAFLPGKVRGGAFEGVLFPKNWIGSALLPKLMGTYEREISKDLKELILDAKIDALIDVGCAGGYYLAVAAYLRKDLQLYGVDASSKVSDTIGEVSSIYGRKIEFKKKFADAEDVLNACVCYRHPLFIVDIEGGEFALFEDLKSSGPLMSQAVFLVEVHEYLNPLWRESFEFLEKTHFVQVAEFGRYYLDEFEGFWERFFGILMRHELRHPKTAYLIARPKSMFGADSAAT